MSALDLDAARDIIAWELRDQEFESSPLGFDYAPAHVADMMTALVAEVERLQQVVADALYAIGTSNINLPMETRDLNGARRLLAQNVGRKPSGNGTPIPDPDPTGEYPDGWHPEVPS